MVHMFKNLHPLIQEFLTAEANINSDEYLA